MNIHIDPQPDFGRLRRTLLLQGKADRVPQFDFNIHESVKEKVLGYRPVSAQDEIDFWVQAGYDYVQIRLKPLDSTQGALQSVSTAHGCLHSMEQLVQGEFEWTPSYNRSWNLEEYNFRYLKEIYRLLPEGMKLIVHAADIYTRSWIAMGFEDFCMALYDQPELVAELFRQNALAELNMLDLLVQEFGDKIGTLLYSDDLAYTEGLMVSANTYRTYLWPYVRQIIDVAKKLDAPVIYHTDGRLWELFDDFAEMGVHGIQPLEPKSMDLLELKEKRGHQFCLMGSIDIDRICRGTPEEIEEMVREKISHLGHNGGYAVGTSNTVPDYVNFENYRAMIEAAHKYGKY